MKDPDSPLDPHAARAPEPGQRGTPARSAAPLTALAALALGLSLGACSDSASSHGQEANLPDAGSDAADDAVGSRPARTPAPSGAAVAADDDVATNDDDVSTSDDDSASNDDSASDDDVAADDDTGNGSAPADDDVSIAPPSDDDVAADDDIGSAGAPAVDTGGAGTGNTPAPTPAPEPVGQVPVVSINHPGDGDVRDPCPNAFPFIATAEDAEDGDLVAAIQWASSRDGELGTGSNFDACLSSGTHTIVARVTDSDGNTGSDSITVTITGNPEPAGAGGASGGPSNTGSDPASDDFGRSSLGSNWELVFPPNSNQVQIIDQSDLGMAPGAQGFFLIQWLGATFSADQFCEATLSQEVDPNWLHQVFVRRRDSDGARYGFGYDGDPSQGNYGDWIFKYDGLASEDTRIVASTPADLLPGPGDALRVEIRGYALKGYFNGELVLEGSDTDPSRIADGRPGLAARWATGNAATDSSVKVFASFRAGSL